MTEMNEPGGIEVENTTIKGVVVGDFIIEREPGIGGHAVLVEGTVQVLKTEWDLAGGRQGVTVKLRGVRAMVRAMRPQGGTMLLLELGPVNTRHDVETFRG